jgi:hypothetical protein
LRRFDFLEELPPAMKKVVFAIREGEWSQAQDTLDAIILVQLVQRADAQTGTEFTV